MFNYKKIISWLLNFAQIQLFLTLLSLPILIAWGLPLSFAAPVGNLVFLPFLMAFLLVSAIIFFFELLWIPNEWCIYILEKITHCWLWLMHWGSATWLISFAKPYPIVFMVIPLSALVIMYHKKITTLAYRCSALFVLLLLFSFYLKYQPRKSAEEYSEIPCNNGVITMIKKNNMITIIDPGVLGQRISTPSWIEYTLLPFFHKNNGSSFIEHLIILQPSIMTFECITKLCQVCTIKNLYLPLWQGTSDKTLLRSYGFMKRALEKSNTTVTRITGKLLIITKDIQITPLSDTLTYRDISFSVVCVTITVADKTLEIYSTKKQK